MATHISRDFAAATTGYFSGFNHVSYLFNTAVFLHKILGYSVVGQSGFNLNNTNNQSIITAQNTAIAAASSGQVLPQATINAVSTTGFPASGRIYVTTSDGYQIVMYSGTTGTTFTNCTGGTGTMSAGFTTTIAAGSNGVALPTSTINVVSTTGFPTAGTIYVITSTGVQTVTYATTNATQFLGCTGGNGTMSTGNSVSSAGVGGIAAGPNRIVSASGNPLIINTQFPHGMTTGDYTAIQSGSGTGMYGLNSNLGNFGPSKVEVISPTQLRLLWTVLGGGYTANSCSILPSGLLIASGTVGAGTGASINFGGAPSVYAVQVPTTVRTVVSGTAPTTGDSGRILVLRSSKYPTKNSGIFKVTAVNTATNSYTIDYRSSETPIADTMDWWLYETETRLSEYLLLPDYNRTSGVGLLTASNTTPIQITVNISAVSYFETGQIVQISGVNGNTAANGTWTITRVGAGIFTLNGSSGNGTYTSGGLATRVGYYGGGNISPNSKIILQSPHATGWQVRVAVEPYNQPQSTPYSSITTGYGGSAFGDFPIGGTHTHLQQFLDFSFTTLNQYYGTMPGAANTTNAPRMTIVGDDSGQSLFAYTRTQSSGNNGMILFGLPSNEPGGQPNINRPFVYGSVNTGIDYGTIQARFGNSFNAGITFKNTNPEICSIAGFINADAVSSVVPNYSSNAGDCPFTTTTELLPWEVWGGVATDVVSQALPYPATGTTVYTVNPRFMGTAPFIRQGRTNFGSFTLSTESTASFTINNATNASPIQITTVSANGLVTGQTVVISGVTGNTNANGTFVITRIDSTNFTLNGTTGNANYISGGIGNGTPGWLHLQNGIYLNWNGTGGLTP